MHITTDEICHAACGQHDQQPTSQPTGTFRDGILPPSYCTGASFAVSLAVGVSSVFTFSYAEYSLRRAHMHLYHLARTVLSSRRSSGQDLQRRGVRYMRLCAARPCVRFGQETLNCSRALADLRCRHCIQNNGTVAQDVYDDVSCRASIATFQSILAYH